MASIDWEQKKYIESIMTAGDHPIPNISQNKYYKHTFEEFMYRYLIQVTLNLSFFVLSWECCKNIGEVY